MAEPATQSEAPWRKLYPFTSHWLDVQGHRMHYLDEGPRDAPVLLMVHGNPTWSFYYRRLVESFRARYRCVVPDHIGCGLSDKPQDWGYRLGDHIDNLEQLVEHLGLSSVTLVLHDWGGAIGMGWAVRAAERVERLVVFNTAAFRSEHIPFSIGICRIPGFGALAVRGFNGFARAAQWRAIFDRRRLKGAIGRGYLAPYDSWRNRIAIHRFVQDIPMNPEHPSWETLVEIERGLSQFEDRPCLIVWGDDDFCFTPQFRREWEKRFPKAQVHALADAGHFVVEDAWERIVPWMAEFLGEHILKPRATRPNE